MIARAFTNVYKYFSPSQRVKPAPALDRRRHCQISRSCKFQGAANSEGAAKRAAAASFVGCQILKAATIVAAAKAAPAL